VGLRDYLRVFRDRWRLVTLVVIVALGLAGGVTAVTRKTYTASAQVLVTSSTTGDALTAAQAAVFVQSQMTTFAAIIGSPDVLHGIQRDLGGGLNDAQLKSMLTADAPSGQTLINIHASDSSASQAAAIANSAARAFITAVETYSTPKGTSTPTIQLFTTDPAVQPTSPSSPNTLVNVLAGLFIGLLLGISLAVLREVLDNRIKEVDVLARVTGVPAMGVVAEDKKTERHVIATRAGSRNVRAENFRQLRANLQFAAVDEQPRIIAITSSLPGEGKTTIAINLASTLAEAGFTVCLVDADLRRPTIAGTLGLLSPVGLTSVLIHQISLAEALQNAGTNLYVLASGPVPPNPSELLASSSLREVMKLLAEKVDFIIMDTAPLLPVADGTEVAALADGTLLIARHGETTEVQVRRAARSLNAVGAKVLGVVLNRVPMKSGPYGYGYTYYAAKSETPSHTSRQDGDNVSRKDRRRLARIDQ